MVDVFAEDDGLGEAVGGLEELGDLGGDEVSALLQDEVLVKVEVVVFAILYFLAVPVGLAFLRAPAIEIFVEANADDFVGCEEAVGDALPERVGVERIAE